MQAQIKDDPAAIFLGIRHRTTIPQIAKIAGSGMWPLEQEVERIGAQMAGPSTFLYYGADGNPNTEFDLLLTVPIASKPEKVGEGFEIVAAPSFHCISVEYVGSMPNIHSGYGVLMEAIGSQGLRPTGESREIYKKWVDYDSNQNVTELQIGIEK